MSKMSKEQALRVLKGLGIRPDEPEERSAPRRTVSRHRPSRSVESIDWHPTWEEAKREPESPNRARIEGQVVYFDPKYNKQLRAYSPVEQKYLWDPLLQILNKYGVRYEDTSYFFADQNYPQLTIEAPDVHEVISKIDVLMSRIGGTVTYGETPRYIHIEVDKDVADGEKRRHRAPPREPVEVMDVDDVPEQYRPIFGRTPPGRRNPCRR